jgi:uncharacterized membrane protein
MKSQSSRRMNDWLLLSGLIGLVVLAVLMDILRRAMLERVDSLGDEQRMLFLLPLMQLLLMLAVLGLIWVAHSGAGYSRWVTIIYLVVGLLLLYTLGLLSALPLPEAIYTIVLYLSLDSFLYQVGGAAAAFGFISLFFWKEDKTILTGGES